MLMGRRGGIGGAHSPWKERTGGSPGTDQPNSEEQRVVWSEIATARREAAMRTDRGWAPTILLCVAILLTAALVVVARPLTADAAGRGHSHAHVHALSRSQSKGAGARHAQQIHVTQGDGHSPNWSGYVA